MFKDTNIIKNSNLIPPRNFNKQSIDGSGPEINEIKHTHNDEDIPLDVKKFLSL